MQVTQHCPCEEAGKGKAGAKGKGKGATKEGAGNTWDSQSWNWKKGKGNRFDGQYTGEADIPQDDLDLLGIEDVFAADALIQKTPQQSTLLPPHGPQKYAGEGLEQQSRKPRMEQQHKKAQLTQKQHSTQMDQTEKDLKT